MKRYSHCRWMCALLIGSSFAFAQGVTLTAHVQLQGAKHREPHDASNAVLWLTPVNGQAVMDSSLGQTRPQPLRLTQRSKSFDPHVLVVPVGSLVEFPNRDPFFHNVFSLFEGKRFDLGLYEAGTTRQVRFDRPGISYIFCNIHAEMSAVVIALDTPYYAISDRQGQIEIPRVPAGRYLLHAWYETALQDTLISLVREITVTENSSSLGLMRLTESAPLAAHKNKYGRDYDKAAPEGSVYQQQ